MSETIRAGVHHAILENRNQLLLTGVTEIDSFDERAVVVYTQLGELTILGKNLHMNRMSIESVKYLWRERSWHCAMVIRTGRHR